jgi:hypothetical protein
MDPLRTTTMGDSDPVTTINPFLVFRVMELLFSIIFNATLDNYAGAVWKQLKVGYFHRYRKKNRLLKVYVPATIVTFLAFFLLAVVH